MQTKRKEGRHKLQGLKLSFLFDLFGYSLPSLNCRQNRERTCLLGKSLVVEEIEDSSVWHTKRHQRQLTVTMIVKKAID